MIATLVTQQKLNMSEAIIIFVLEIQLQMNTIKIKLVKLFNCFKNY